MRDKVYECPFHSSLVLLDAQNVVERVALSDELISPGLAERLCRTCLPKTRSLAGPLKLGVQTCMPA